jgi:hypothetical protein
MCSMKWEEGKGEMGFTYCGALSILSVATLPVYGSQTSDIDGQVRISIP